MFFFPALLTIDADGTLKTIGWFDFETNSKLEYNMSCDISYGNTTRTFHTVMQIFVLDVDDNAPYVQDNTKLFQELDITQVIPVISHFVIILRISTRINVYGCHQQYIRLASFWEISVPISLPLSAVLEAHSPI